MHHLLMYECGAEVTFDDDNLPDGLCDDNAIKNQIGMCMINIASVWAVGGDYVRYTFMFVTSDYDSTLRYR